MKVFLAFVWIVGWLAGTLLFDVHHARRCYQQWRSSSFPSVKGRVSHCNVITHESSKGPRTYSVDVSYDYVQGNTHYTSTRYRYGATRFHGDHAREAVGRLRRNNDVDVYYDPENPAEAALQTELLGADFSPSVFLLFFNAVAVGTVVGLAYSLKEKLRRLLFRAQRIERFGVTQLSIIALSPVATAIVTALAMSIIFVITIGTIEHMKIDPTIPVIAAIWTIFLVTVTGIYSWARLARRGNQDLCVNRSTDEITIPRGFGRNDKLIVRGDQIESFELDETTSQDLRGKQSTHYFPTIAFKAADGTIRRERLAEWYPRERAESFVAWLRTNVLFELRPDGWHERRDLFQLRLKPGA